MSHFESVISTPQAPMSEPHKPRRTQLGLEYNLVSVNSEADTCPARRLRMLWSQGNLLLLQALHFGTSGQRLDLGDILNVLDPLEILALSLLPG